MSEAQDLGSGVGAPAPAQAVTRPGLSVAPSGASGAAVRSFLQGVEQALNEIVTLRIVTLVGDVTVAGTGLAATVTVRGGTSAEAASTEIDLLNGHITNTFSPGFAALSGGDLKSLHESRVEKSQAIITANLAEVQKLASALLAPRR